MIAVKLSASKLAPPTNAPSILSWFKSASENELQGILEYTEEPLVSIDLNGNPHSSIVDALSTNVLDGNFAKVLSWYDNEWGFSCRVVNLIQKMAESL